MRYFFFQAEDGIRDHCVTGVQTCALPILIWRTCGSLRADELLSEPQVRQIMEYYLAVRMRRYGRTFQPTETSSHADRALTRPAGANGRLPQSASPVGAGIGSTVSTVRPVSRSANREPGRY